MQYTLDDVKNLLSNAAGDQDEPLGMTDEDLLSLAYAASEELRRRVPRYAFEQGDLDYQDAQQVAQMETAERSVLAVKAMQDAWMAVAQSADKEG